MKKALFILCLLLSLCLFCACNEEEGGEHTHVWGEWIETTAPTCTSAGWEKRTCACGGCEMQKVEIAHKWGEWGETTAPTCIANGVKTRTCTDCGTAQTGTVPVTETHNYNVNNVCADCNVVWPYTATGIVYADNGDGTCTVSGLDTNIDPDVVIPYYHDGKSVTGIKDSAFENRTDIVSVSIPSSIIDIGSDAFYDCTGLAGVYITDIAAWCQISFGGFDANPLCYAKKLYLNGVLVTDLVIPAGVTSIVSYAFFNCEGLKSVTIPDSVTSLGEGAFAGCIGLTSVAIPDSVTSIGLGAYAYCIGLTSVAIPDSVTSIGEAAFAGCTGLTAITVARRNKVYHSAGNCLIETASKMLILGCKTSVIPTDGSVTGIGGGAFLCCSGLAFVTIPDSVTSIGEVAFAECTDLVSVMIPDSVTRIGESAFTGCTGLTGVYITNLTAWCQIPFANPSANPLNYAGNLYLNGSLVTDLVIPNGVTTIDDYAFYNCTGLASVTIPDSVTSIDHYAFYKCTGLTSVTIPNSVTSIGSDAFRNCTGLTSVTIPNSVTSIGYYAFSGCSNLTTVNCTTTGWWVSTTETATSGTAVQMTASNLTGAYFNYYWKRG